METAISILQSVLILASAVIAWQTVRMLRDSRKVDLMVAAENSAEAAFIALQGQEIAVLRSIFQDQGLGDLSDHDLATVPFFITMYSSVARLHYFLTDNNLDLGMSKLDREQQLESWMTSLQRYASHPALTAIHLSARERRDYDPMFLDRFDAVINAVEAHSSDSSTLESSEGDIDGHR